MDSRMIAAAIMYTRIYSEKFAVKDGATLFVIFKNEFARMQKTNGKSELPGHDEQCEYMTEFANGSEIE